MNREIWISNKSLVAIKLSLVAFSVVALAISLSLLVPVLAAHDSTAELQPEWSPAHQEVDYSVEICNYHLNNGGEDIDEVRIYMNPSYSYVTPPSGKPCEEKTGWELIWISTKQACQYVASEGYYIKPGQCQTFYFSATTPAEGCEFTWDFETRDRTFPDPGSINYLQDTTSVDDEAPVITKTLGEPKIENGGTWITQNTPIHIEVYDEGECGISGLDYCEYRYDVDGVEVLPWTTIVWDNTDEISGVMHYYYTFTYDEDSLHHLEIRCYDIAENMAYHEQWERVDTEEPDTTKVVSEPKKKENGVEWIDTKTEITLCADDPDPTKEGCNIGVDKTWYKNVVYTEKTITGGPSGYNYCYDPVQYCNAKYLPTPTPYDQEEYEGCIDDAQADCDRYGHGTPEWYACMDEWLVADCKITDWKLYDGTPIQKDEESCHVLYYFSVDHLGNVEDMQYNCFFVDKTPPEVDKEVGTPKVDETNEEEVGNGKVSWTTSQYHSGTSSAELSMVDGTQDWAGIDVLVDIALEDIDSLTFWELIKEYSPPMGWSVNVILGVDSDGDGVFESDIAAWHVPHPGHNPAVLGDDTFIEMDGVTKNPTTGVWTLTDAYNTQQWWTTNAAGDGLSSDCYQTLGNFFACSDMKPNLEPTDHVKLIKLEIGGSGSWNNEKALVDELKLNGQVILDDITTDRFTWVTPETDITFTCDDPLPHPSGDEELCFKVSYDQPSYPTYLTTDYCAKYVGEGAYMEGDWCCVDASPIVGSPFVFNFNTNEDSLHDLEYYCRDAVEKESDTYIQYYKVDAVPPVITKTMIGTDHLGDCPPGATPSEPCYVRDYGQNGVRIDVEDGQGLCMADDVTCTYELWWEGQNIDSGAFGEEGKDIIFTLDSTHILKIWCQDALGNPVYDEEEFLVDSTPPVTTKTYGDPKKLGTFDWITSKTPITLKATDEKVGVDYTKYRYCLLPDCYYTYSQTRKCECPKETPWLDWDGNPFTIPQDSEHCIEYYSDDKLGNLENTKSQCVYVDNKEPEITKTIKGPQSGDCPPEQGDICYIDGVTEICISAIDPMPHPVDEVECYWWYFVDGQRYPTSGVYRTFPITFPEESKHELHVKCKDALENEVEDIETFYVDKTAPTTTKTYVGPYHEENSVEWIDGVTEVELTVEDTGEHKSGIKETKYRVTLVRDDYCWRTVNCDDAQGSGDWQTYSSPFKIDDESCHLIEYYSVDNVDKKEETKKQCVFVDKTEPTTTKTYDGPQYPEDIDEEIPYPHWITNETEVKLCATDTGPHPSGVVETYYEVTRLEDPIHWYYCNETCDEWVNDVRYGLPTAPEPYNPSKPIIIEEESCHIIEYYSIDNVDKVEDVKWQCVFVDNTPPDPDKEVGEPKTKWDGSDSYFYHDETAHCWDETGDEIECWKVTMLTPIHLDCEDQGDHPVDHEEVCFQVGVDGEDATDDYCNNNDNHICIEGFDNCDNNNNNHYEGEMKNGWCCVEHTIEDFYFTEETEHNLKYYCIDALGNKGEIDEEKFKVEGTTFEIPLKKKWNLISVPFVLLDDNPEVVFNETKEYIESVWAYDSDPQNPLCGHDWCVYIPDGNGENGNLEDILPGWGYWVLANNCTTLKIGGSLFSPRVIAPSRNLVKGWNLIGYYGTEWQEYDEDPDCQGWARGYNDLVYCSLNSLIDTQEGYPRWSSLWTYMNCKCEDDNNENNINNHNRDCCYCESEYNTPECWIGLNTCVEGKKRDKMYAGWGYWIELDVEDLYSPASTCVWNEDFECIQTPGGHPH